MDVEIAQHAAPASDGDGPEMSRWLAAALRPAHALLMPRLFEIAVAGREHIPPAGPIVIAPTHRSRWDGFLLHWAFRPRSIYFLSSDVEVVGAQRWFMRRLGCLAVDVERPSPSAIRDCRHVLERGDALAIFPEGDLYYYRPGEVHPLKPGAARLALAIGRRCPGPPPPIVPVRLVYGDRLPRPGCRVEVRIGRPIEAGDLEGLAPRLAAASLTAALQEALGEVVDQASSHRSRQEAIAEWSSRPGPGSRSGRP